MHPAAGLLAALVDSRHNLFTRDSEERLKMQKQKWTKPSFTEMRFGMEVTMYILNR